MTAKKHTFQSATTMRGHDDKIVAQFFRSFNDRCRRMWGNHMKRMNFDFRFSRQFARTSEGFIGILVPFLLEALDEGRAISPAARKPRNGIGAVTVSTVAFAPTVRASLNAWTSPRSANSDPSVVTRIFLYMLPSLLLFHL